MEGGDGFELWGTDNIGNADHIVAVVIDVTLPTSGAPAIVPPTNPADEATGIALSPTLVAPFDKPIALTGSGSVTIYNVDTTSNHEEILLPDPARVSAAGFNLTITSGTPLATGTNYAVLISNDAVKNLNSADTFAGVLTEGQVTYWWPRPAAPARSSRDGLTSGVS